MIAPRPKSYGIGSVYSSTTETISRSFNMVNKLAMAGEFLADGAVINAKVNILDQYQELLAKFGVDTSHMTPAEVRIQAESLLDF